MSQPTQLTAAGLPLKGEVLTTLDEIPPLGGAIGSARRLGRESGAASAEESGADAAGIRPPSAAYLHVPFCFHKCHYCDFYSIVDSRDRRPQFTDRLVAELAAAMPWLSAPLTAVFVGGGTPTLLDVDQWRCLLRAMAASLPGFPGCECTVEANPETVTPVLLETLAGGGVDRVSIGAQSFDRRHLATLERHHDPDAVVRAVAMARANGIRRVSLDLIFGVPGQTLDEWRRDLDQVLALEPSHLSCYGLMYEPNTALTRRRDLGRIEPIDPEIEATMYECTLETLAAAGFEHYEVSNWARPGEQCRHNLEYWRGGSWWAFGPSAVGQLHDATGLGGWRWRNVPRLGDWLDVGPFSPVVDVERIDAATARAEAFMLGLRVLEGMERGAIDELLAGDPDAGRRRETIESEVACGRLEWSAGERLRLTPAGLMLADAVVGALL